MDDREENRQFLIARGHVIHFRHPGWGDQTTSECNEMQVVTTDRPEEVTCERCIGCLAGEVEVVLRNGEGVR